MISQFGNQSQTRTIEAERRIYLLFFLELESILVGL